MKNYSRLILGAGVWVYVGLVSLSYISELNDSVWKVCCYAGSVPLEVETG